MIDPDELTGPIEPIKKEDRWIQFLHQEDRIEIRCAGDSCPIRFFTNCGREITHMTFDFEGAVLLDPAGDPIDIERELSSIWEVGHDTLLDHVQNGYVTGHFSRRSRAGQMRLIARFPGVKPVELSGFAIQTFDAPTTAYPYGPKSPVLVDIDGIEVGDSNHHRLTGVVYPFHHGWIRHAPQGRLPYVYCVVLRTSHGPAVVPIQIEDDEPDDRRDTPVKWRDLSLEGRRRNMSPEDMQAVKRRLQALEKDLEEGR